MKRTVQMQNAGIPKAGTRQAHARRRPHWRQERIIGDDGSVSYRTPPLALVIHPVRRARLAREYERDLRPQSLLFRNPYAF